MKKLIISVLLVLLFAWTLFFSVHAYTYAGYTFYDDYWLGGWAISYCDKSVSGYIQIPYSLEANNTIAKVVAINDSAFEDCNKIVSIITPYSLKTIGNNAFKNCTSLTSVGISYNVTSVSTNAFDGCFSLTNISVDENNQTYCSIDGNLYTKDKKTLLKYAPGKQESNFSVPSTVTTIGTNAFAGNNYIETVTLPSALTKIENYAFADCKNISSIVLPDKVTTVGDYSFRNCENLKKIYISKSVTELNDFTFYGCSNLSEITVDDNNTAYCSIDGNLYNKNKTSLIQYAVGKNDATFVIPDSITSLDVYTFRNAKNLTAITIPASLSSLSLSYYSPFTFENCVNIKEVYIYDLTSWCKIDFSMPQSNPLSYGAKLYLNGKLLTDLVVPNDIYTLKSHTFNNCDSITSVTIHNKVTSIGNYVFSECDNLTNINVATDSSTYASVAGVLYDKSLTTLIQYPIGRENFEYEILNSVTTIGRGAFSFCKNLHEITCYNLLKKIDYKSFNKCENLKQIYFFGTDEDWNKITIYGITSEIYYLTNSIKLFVSLEDSTISINDCNITASGLISVPEKISGYSVSKISNNAFEDCSKIDIVHIPDTVNVLADYVFKNCTNLQEIYLSNNITSIGASAFYNCESLKTIVIPNSVTVINSYTFYNCINLTNVIINGELSDIKEYAFYNCQNLTDIDIPNSISTLGSNAFRYCSSLTSITLPSGIKSLPSYAFGNCAQLISIVIPDSLNSISSNSFYGCGTDFIVYGTKNSAGKNLDAFIEIDNLIQSGSCGQNISYSFYENGTLIIRGTGDITNFSSAYDVPWFNVQSQILTVVIERGTNNLPENCFYNAINLMKIKIPRSVTNISAEAFLTCDKLEEVCVADENQYFCNDGDGVLYNKEMTTLVYCPSGFSIKAFKIPLSTSVVGPYSFNKCSNLDTLIIPRNIQSIDDSAINNEFIKSIVGYDNTVAQTYATNNQITFKLISYTGTCGESIEYFECTDGTLYIFGEGAMQNYNNLSGKYASKSPWYSSSTIKNIIIGEGVTDIGSYSFYNCNNLESIYLSSTVNAIGASAFEGCSNIRKIYMSDISSLFNIDFSGSNPIAIAGGNVYVDNQLVTEITIPSNITTIKQDAFRNHDTLTKIVLHNKITTIGSSAFYDCDGVTEIMIPDSVTTIGNYAFYSCGKLTEIVIPDSVTEIGDYAFKSSAIKDIVIGDGITDIGEQAFYDSRLESITLGKSIKTIGKNAFTYCYITKVNLTSVETWLNISFGNSGSNPLGSTMYSSADLYINNELAKHITIPDGITTIGDNAFYYCDEIRSISIPSSVTHIGKSSFYDCDRLLDVYFKGTREQWNSVEKTNSYIEVACIHCADEAELPYSPESDFVFSNGVISSYTGSDKIINVPAEIGGIPVKMIADGAFSIVSATQIYLPEGIVQIGKSAFQNRSVRRVNIPSTVKSIGSYAFYMTDIVEMEIPEGIKTIPTYTFAYCSNLEKLSIPSSIETIESDAFCSTHVEELHISDLGAWCNISFADSDSTPMYSNTLLCVNGEVAIDVTIPDNATQISKYAFYKYDKLKSVVVPSSVKSIGDYAFYECSSLEKINIPDGITNIGYQSFYECSSLERVIIPNSVTNIGYQSFYNCSTLDYVKIGSGVKSINNSAFAGCSKLTDVDMGDNVAYIGSDVFKDCVNLQSIIIPQVTNIPSNAFYNCYALKQIEIPKTVISIGNSAFYACYGITDVYYQGNKNDWTAITIGTENEPLTYGTVHFDESVYLSIVFDANGGTNAPTPQQICENGIISITYDIPSKTGNKFLGWSKSADATTPEYQSGDSVSVGTENVTLYAVWEANTYSVTFNANGGENAPEVQTKVHDVVLTLSSAIPTRMGYTFLGWSTSSDGEVEYGSGAAYTKEENVTLYAVWEANTYSVTFNANGGENAPEVQIKAYEIDITISDIIPTKEGFKFKGWATSKNGNIAYLPGDKYVINSNVTLYAVWEEIKINYGDTNGDSRVDIKDIVLLAQYLAGWDVSLDLDAADCNNDGESDIKDIVLLAQYLAGWEVTLG